MAASPSLARDLEHDLRRRVSGEVRFDPISRVLYSTDASIYEIEPIGVVVPRDEGDVQAVVEVARSAKVPLLPRGGGTSLAGQAVGRALVLDFSKYMNRVLEVDAEAGWARVQPGIVRDELVAALAPTGLTFGPETSTSNRATIGGMIGNNSSGARSIVYGKTVDNVLAVRVVLAGGETVLLEPLPLEEARARGRREGAEGRLYREILRIVEATRDEVARRFPKILRRVGGYNLDEFPPGGPINLAKLVVGSEGTLGVVTEATLRLAPRPRLTALAVLHFDDLIRALESTCVALETGPAAVELIDKLVLDMARQAREHARRMTFVEGDPGGAPGPAGGPGDPASPVGIPGPARAPGGPVAPGRPVGGPKGRGGAAPRDEDGPEAHRLRRGHGCLAGAGGGVRAPLPRDRGAARDPGVLLRPRERGAAPRAPDSGPEDGAGRGGDAADRRGDQRPRAGVRGGAERGARRRACAQPVHREDVRPHAVPGLPRGEGGV